MPGSTQPERRACDVSTEDGVWGPRGAVLSIQRGEPKATLD